MSGATAARVSGAGVGPPVTVRDWWDVYEVEPAAVAICPDCEQRSPELDNVYALVRWVSQHGEECLA